MNLKQFRLILQKEFTYLLRDRKSILTSILVTVAITPLLFGVLQFIEKVQAKQAENSTLTIAVSEMDRKQPFVLFMEQQPNIKVENSSDIITDLKDGKVTSGLEFEQDANTGFINLVYLVDERNNVSNNSTPIVSSIFNTFAAQARSSNLTSLGIREVQIDPYKFSSDTLQKRIGEVGQSGLILFLLPYLILLGLIQGSMNYAIEITTGEKERNTLATTLSLDIPSALVAGSKMVVVSVFSIFFLILNIGSLVITFALFPEMTGGAGLRMDGPLLLRLIIIMFPLTLLFAALLVLLGIYARNQKEAGIYAMPLMMAVIFIGFTANVFDANTPTAIFAVPIIGHVAAIKQALLGVFNVPGNVLLFATTTAVLAVIVFITMKMFRREEVLFRQ